MYYAKLISARNQEPTLDNSFVLGGLVFNLSPRTGDLQVSRRIGESGRFRSSLLLFEISGTIINSPGYSIHPESKILFEDTHIVVVPTDSGNSVHAYVWNYEEFYLLGGYNIKGGRKRALLSDYEPETESDNDEPSSTSDDLAYISATEFIKKSKKNPLILGKDYGAVRTTDWIVSTDTIPRKYLILARNL